MSKEWEPTCYEFYERLHRQKGKPDEWFNEKQAKIVELFQVQKSEAQIQSGEGSSHESTLELYNDIYMEVAGGINKKGRIFGGINKKGRIFGLGSQVVAIKSSGKNSISNDATS
ncbi:uncharacterized protein LOC127106114 [Lathyrus oleraceus]|uniref:uncharacterized protein LOC127106114 n=1 Tax=Pisum sativum TaxID=3888 RepID=UPI0021CF2224|nr:uncharacterized protein LOC127106114 [Pisum sativum]